MGLWALGGYGPDPWPKNKSNKLSPWAKPLTTCWVNRLRIWLWMDHPSLEIGQVRTHFNVFYSLQLYITANMRHLFIYLVYVRICYFVYCTQTTTMFSGSRICIMVMKIHSKIPKIGRSKKPYPATRRQDVEGSIVNDYLTLSRHPSYWVSLPRPPHDNLLKSGDIQQYTCGRGC